MAEPKATLASSANVDTQFTVPEEVPQKVPQETHDRWAQLLLLDFSMTKLARLEKAGRVHVPAAYKKLHKKLLTIFLPSEVRLKPSMSVLQVPLGQTHENTNALFDKLVWCLEQYQEYPDERFMTRSEYREYGINGCYRIPVFAGGSETQLRGPYKVINPVEMWPDKDPIPTPTPEAREKIRDEHVKTYNQLRRIAEDIFVKLPRNLRVHSLSDDYKRVFETFRIRYEEVKGLDAGSGDREVTYPSDSKEFQETADNFEQARWCLAHIGQVGGSHEEDSDMDL